MTDLETSSPQTTTTIRRIKITVYGDKDENKALTIWPLLFRLQKKIQERSILLTNNTAISSQTFVTLAFNFDITPIGVWEFGEGREREITWTMAATSMRPYKPKPPPPPTHTAFVAIYHSWKAFSHTLRDKHIRGQVSVWRPEKSFSSTTVFQTGCFFPS